MPESLLEFNPLLRISGLVPTAQEVLAEALSEQGHCISGPPPSGDIHARDPYQIDPALAVEVVTGAGAPEPTPGATYAGLTPEQRGAFLLWAQDPMQPAPPAFQRLLIAHVEVGLLDGMQTQQTILRELVRWGSAPPWRVNQWHARVMLLGLWLRSNGEGIANWTAAVAVPPDIMELAIGLQMLLGPPLSVTQIGRVAEIWDIPGAHSTPDVIGMRLRSTTDTLGKPPLQYALDQMTSDPQAEDECSPRPWRTAHRGLRFSLPQPQVRPYLQPVVEEMLAMADSGQSGDYRGQQEILDPSQEAEWRLVLEFGHSRSEFYMYALELAQRMPGYLQLMDENRRLVHRVAFRKGEMRRFWRIWEYVKNWSSTHVYVNGEELEQWKVWPYSQYLR